MFSRDGRDDARRAGKALERVEERVQRVRHLHPFEVSVREGGRFRCELVTPVEELSAEDRRAVAAALEELAELVRPGGDG